jgi:hypothetical protein
MISMTIFRIIESSNLLFSLNDIFVVRSIFYADTQTKTQSLDFSENNSSVYLVILTFSLLAACTEDKMNPFPKLQIFVLLVLFREAKIMVE